MMNVFRLSSAFRACALIALALLVAGCQQRLAERHEYFAPYNDPGERVATETERTLRYLQQLQLARRACVANGPAVDSVSPGALVCAPAGRARAAYGSRANAYQRWVDDQVRPLPSPSRTASSIGGG